MSKWETVAFFLEKEYGAYVDWKECFYVCPSCGEPVYEEDFDFEGLCPICEWEGED